MKKIILVGGAGFMLWMYMQSDKDTPPKITKFVVDGKIVPESKLESKGYYYYQTDSGDIPSGYYNYTSFPTGFPIALDKDYIKAAFEHIRKGTDLVQIVNAHKLLKQYYNGTMPLQTA